MYTLASGSSVRRDADGALIPADPSNRDWGAYQAWLADGNTPAPTPGPTVGELVASAEKAWRTMLLEGQSFDVAASGAAAVPIFCDGTNDTRADLALLALYGQQNPAGTKTWVANNGVTTSLTGAELVTLATLAGNWVSDTYPALMTLIGDITAESPTVTTTAQIDAYAWPTS